MKEILLKLGLIDEKNIEIYSNKTRDGDILVYRDSKTGVIFIDGYFVGNKEYELGEYRTKINNGDLENSLDTKRRWNDFKQFTIGKNIVDFGCGYGSFLKISHKYTKSSVGIEIQKDYRTKLNKSGIKCLSSLNQVKNIDVFFLFHVLEHLNNPIETLKKINLKLVDGGKIVIEVPHACDFLLDKCPEFKNFTLWSQHLILHTRESLKVFLKEAGFKDIVIKGIQRYGISNHMQWLKSGVPGGHINNMSLFETKELYKEYSNALGSIDANDTLILVATK